MQLRSNTVFSRSFLKYFKNSFWMLSEYALRVISAIFVTVYVARYIGPESFGVLMYALAIVSVFMAISRMGMDSILVRELSLHTRKAPEMLGTAFWLMAMVASLSFLLLWGLVPLIEEDSDIRLYILIISVGIGFQTFYIADYNFQSIVKAKYSSIAKSLALSVSAILKIYLVYLKAELLVIVISFALDFVWISMALLITHVIKRQPNFFTKFDKDCVMPLLRSAWPMVLSTLAIIMYMRTDQIMIKNMLGTYELGLYSAGTRIYEGWIMVFVVISTSLLPAIAELKKSSLEQYEKRLSQLFSLLFWGAMMGSVFVAIYSEEIIRLVFGQKFMGAQAVFMLVMWSAPFAAIGSLTARYLTIERMERKIAIRTVAALFINVSLNMVLIPFYGIEGAAIATLIAIIFGNYLINFFDKDFNGLVRTCNKGIFFGV